MIICKIIWILISIILLIFTYVKLGSLIAPFVLSNNVFGHPIKTHQNGIGNFRINAIVYFVFFIALFSNNAILIYFELILLSIFIPASFYVWSEVKHLSPDDELYIKDAKAYKYYKTYSTFGLINMFNNLFLVIFLVIDFKYNFYFYIFLVFEIILFVLLGMSDLLNLSGQYHSSLPHKVYLKEQHKQIFKETSMNIIRFFIYKNVRTAAIKNLKVNLHNIRCGSKSVKY